MAEIQKIKYSSNLQKVLFPDNSFYKKSVGETGIADDVASVERPVQGSLNKAKYGQPTTLPLKIQASQDSKDSYDTTLIYADPVLVKKPDEFALSYNKQAAKQQQQAGVINTGCADYAAQAWGPTNSNQILKTSGSSRASNIVDGDGTVIANRKAVTKADMIKVYNLLMRMNISGIPGQLYALVTSDFYSDLQGIAEFTDYDKTGVVSKLEKGILGRIMGIEIMTRSTDDYSTGLSYSSSYSKLDLGTSLSSTSCPANLFWHSAMVCRAEGKVGVNVTPNAPGCLGATLLEAWTRFGASWSRYDQKGVVSLLEENA